MLRLLLAFIISCTLALHSKAQNLVPNPSFEEQTGCYSLDDDCNDWFTFKQTPDYVNGCSTLGYDNGAGFQLPKTGEAYTGFISYFVNSPIGPNIREHYGVALKSPLVIGEKYYVSFYVSSGYTNSAFNIACNKIGALFTTYTYYSAMGDDIPNPNFAQVSENSIIVDTSNWTRISGSFIADSAYTFIILGNFYDDIYTDTLHFPSSNSNSRISYYFVDDVCVSKDSLSCALWLKIPQSFSPKPEISCYPNPVNSVLHIKSDYPFHSFELVNNLGQIVLFSDNLNSKALDIVVQHLPKGFYFLSVSQMSESYNVKILIN